MMTKIYTVVRTVEFYFEVEANSEQEALAEADGLGIGAAFQEDQITQDVINVEEVQHA